MKKLEKLSYDELCKLLKKHLDICKKIDAEMKKRYNQLGSRYRD